MRDAWGWGMRASLSDFAYFAYFGARPSGLRHAALRSLRLRMRCSFTLYRSTNRVTAVTGGENSEDATLSIGLGKWGRATPGQLLQSFWDWLLSSPQNGLQGRLKTCDTADCKSASRRRDEVAQICNLLHRRFAIGSAPRALKRVRTG